MGGEVRRLESPYEVKGRGHLASRGFLGVPRIGICQIPVWCPLLAWPLGALLTPEEWSVVSEFVVPFFDSRDAPQST